MWCRVDGVQTTKRTAYILAQHALTNVKNGCETQCHLRGETHAPSSYMLHYSWKRKMYSGSFHRNETVRIQIRAINQIRYAAAATEITIYSIIPYDDACICMKPYFARRSHRWQKNDEALCSCVYILSYFLFFLLFVSYFLQFDAGWSGAEMLNLNIEAQRKITITTTNYIIAFKTVERTISIFCHCQSTTRIIQPAAYNQHIRT